MGTLAAVLDALPDGAALLEGGIIRYAGAPLGALLGRPAADLRGTRLVDLAAPADRRALRNELRRRGGPVSLSCGLVRADGTEVPVQVVLAPVALPAGVDLLCVCRPAEEVAAADLLRYLTKAVETMQLGLTITDVDRQIIYVNPADAAMHGYTVDELLGRDCRIFAPGGPKHDLTRDELRMMTGWVREAQNVRKDGSVFPVRLLSDVVKDEAGEPLAVVTVCEDITERRRVEQALRRSEERHRAIVEHASYGIYRTNAGGQFVSVNPALARMLGYDSTTELLGVDLETAVYGDPEQRVLLSRYVVDDRPIAGLELPWKRKDGLPVFVRLSGRAVRTADGAFDGFEMIVEDVTERRELEDQLRRAQKVEAIGQLTGGIAHDFNNLLTVIAANASLLEAALPADAPGLLADLAEIQGAARRGQAMVQKLLSFTRHDRLVFERVDLGDLVRQQARVLARLLPADIEVRLAVPDDLPPVQADPGAVEQIVVNVATNARDAMPDGGLLSIQMGRSFLDEEFRATLGWGEPGEYVFVAVSDTGVGMDRETLSRVFEPFFTTKQQRGGTGLGLAMVYGFMKQHRGFINVYSEAGEGTTVKLLFPAAAGVSEDEREKPTLPDRAVHGGTETVLVAEDEAPILRATKRVLEKYGYRVLAAPDGAEALRVYDERAAEIDLVISDLVMPRMGGRDLYLALRERGARATFLFTSGYSARDVREGLSVDPEVPFLHKPWTVTDLLVRVRECLDG